MTFDEMIACLNIAFDALSLQGEHERAKKLETIKGGFIAYGRKCAVVEGAPPVLRDCIKALDVHGCHETANGLQKVLKHLQPPLDGAQRMQEVDAAQAKNIKHLEAARNSLHRVTFIGIGPDGMRKVCDMLDEIGEMIERLTKHSKE